MPSTATDNAESEHLRPKPAPYWQPLFDHMSTAHGLILIEDELHQIARAVDKARKNAGDGYAVCWVCHGKKWVPCALGEIECQTCRGSGKLKR